MQSNPAPTAPAALPDDITADALALCEMFEEELNRQERILDLVRGQGQAARTRNIGTLARVSRELTQALQDAATSDKQRRSIVARLAARHGLPNEDITLSTLTPFLPQTCQVRLAVVRARLQQTLAASRSAAAANRQVLCHGLRTAENSLGHVTQQRPCEPAAAYTHQGAYGSRIAPRAAFVDSRG